MFERHYTEDNTKVHLMKFDIEGQKRRIEQEKEKMKEKKGNLKEALYHMRNFLQSGIGIQLRE